MSRESTKLRIQKMLNSDKEEMNEATRDSALADFSRVVREYFEPNEEVRFEIKKVKSAYEVCVRFQASRIKNFTIVK